MIKQSASEIFTLLVVLASAMVVSAAAAPGVARRPIRDEPPKLSDTLAVAKSPYEPVTLAAQLVGDPPNARNDSPPTVVASELNSDESQQALKTTRSTQAGVIEQQEKDTTQIRGLDEQSSDDSPASSSATTSSPAIGGPEATTETSTATVDGTEAGSTTSREEPTEATSTTPSSATDITLATTTTTVAPTEAAETTTAAAATTEAPSSSSTEAAAEDSSAATKAEELVTGEPAASTTAAVAATETTTPAAPERSDEAPKEQAKPIPEKEETSPAPTPEATTTTAPVESPATEAPTTPAATTTTTTTTTTEPPTTSTTTAPAEPKQEEKSKEEARQQPQTSCNHLPTYDAEEVQKVFREETTFRNGTIRGKFTYINFDSRYRLVHYTRLPYGPVKIDLVEELGRPEPASNGSRLSPSSSSSSSATATPNEVPNAVLQLRNILPNSLFGFPFVAPNSMPSNKPLDPRDGATSPGSNLYSTEALATPNLPLSPSVPVSSLSGRREPGQAHAGAAASPALQDTLAQNLNDDIALSVNQPVATPLRPAQPRQAIQLGDTWESHLQQAAAAAATASGPSANNLQFQYALSSQANHLEAAAKQAASGPAYTYFGGQPASSYQYSPLPLYAFQQPSYFSAHHHHNQLPLQTATIALAAPVQPANKPALVSHQPHDHEHFIAPFMLSQAPSSEQPASDQPTRLKLRVKSAKSLNHNSGLKSAQLRATQDESVSSQQQHHYSPAQAYRQSSSQGRHRAGKQNQELRPTVNAAPVVYHVLRSPVGRMYSLPQYRNVHAVAYDLDV